MVLLKLTLVILGVDDKEKKRSQALLMVVFCEILSEAGLSFLTFLRGAHVKKDNPGFQFSMEVCELKSKEKNDSQKIKLIKRKNS